MKLPKLKFRIGSLLVAIAFAALTISWWTDRNRRQPGIYLHVMTHADPNAPSPPKLLCSTAVVPHHEFRVELPSCRSVSGVINSHPAGGCRAKLSGQFRSGFLYDGPIELEELTDTQLTSFSGAVEIPVIVFTRSPHVQEFLDKQHQRDKDGLPTDAHK